MTEQQSPQEQLNSKLDSIRWKLQNLQSEVQFSSVRRETADLDSKVNNLPNRAREMRAKGYVFGKGLEKKITDVRLRWTKMSPMVYKQIDTQAPALQMELTILAAQMNQVTAASSRPAAGLAAATRFEGQLSTFDSKVSAAQNAIRNSFSSYATEVSELEEEIKRIEWMLTQINEGCFKLLPTEGGLMAVEARWARDEKMDKDDPRGVLYLTDQRLLFEQKEEVATKKFLFITTEKEKVQNLLLDVPLGLIEKVESAKKGLFKNEDHLIITFKSGAPVRSAWLHLDGQECNWWQGLIGQATAHEFDDERAVAIDKKVVEKVRSVPTECPNCGAPMNQQVLRGMDSVQCEYCQHTIRI